MDTAFCAVLMQRFVATEVLYICDNTQLREMTSRYNSQVTQYAALVLQHCSVIRMAMAIRSATETCRRRLNALQLFGKATVCMMCDNIKTYDVYFIFIIA